MNGNYPAIFLNGKNVHIHCLEWQKHFGEIPKGCIVHHKDEDKTNWNIDNLELISRADHVRKHKRNLHSHTTSKYGEESRHHKLTQADVDYIRKHYKKYDKYFGARALSKMFNVTEQCVGLILNGKNWKVWR